jgi:hypothetical protein
MKTRKIVSLVLALVMLLAIAVPAGAEGFRKVKVAYATNATDETFVGRKKGLEELVGPTLNMEFMYSEALSDAGALTTFIENAFASGCEGVFVDLANAMDQGAAVANDLGMWYVGVSSADSAVNYDLPYYVSVVGASAQGYGTSYATAIESVLSDGEEHSILILSGAAAYGATSFIEGTAGSLRALQEIYGLTYTRDINELATSSTSVDAENDKGVKITVVPGMGPDLTNTVSPMLQSGEYDVVVGTTTIYGSLSVAVDEVEKATGKNIFFISRDVLSDTIGNAFHTNDSTGHPVMDAVVTQATFETVSGMILLRNAIDGYADNMRAGGRCSRVPGSAPLVVVSAEQFDILSAEGIPFAFCTAEDILALTGPDATWEAIDAFGASLTTEAVIEKFNK